MIAPDLLGHGESAKPMGDYSLGAHASGLRDLLVTLGVPSATIVGHSFGGGVAMQLSYQHPELCDRLVLTSSGGLGREVSWLLRMLTLPLAEQLMPIAFPPGSRPGNGRQQVPPPARSRRALASARCGGRTAHSQERRIARRSCAPSARSSIRAARR